jgi:hypothetical protein
MHTRADQFWIRCFRDFEAHSAFDFRSHLDAVSTRIWRAFRKDNVTQRSALSCVEGKTSDKGEAITRAGVDV